jgi:hypothetical protein
MDKSNAKSPPRGGGRPVGSKSRYGPGSVKELEKLGFDPLKELVRLYKRKQQRSYTSGLTQSEVNELETEQRMIAQTLLPYRYQPVKTDEGREGAEPLMIEAVVTTKDSESDSGKT